ncbi:8-oxo-dGTP diphosphatase [Hypnocyclicus thermotrophus]|uniref:8-oxo-dGTP diphosphatase n=1 Tax=Hypnocyclicus thermotrophus TaxID=1627895 RepID=A0AA46DX54_9FUSO|nr:NUDIX domain-containing protein [Hypnocyclicus thermotrophus]TDT67417.1 8-oxo-dGTP diphosphatase [Hypnocyclicus thermotrophus]
MVKIDFYDLDIICKYKYVVLVAKYNKKLVLVKHKNRESWEIPGGHIEKNETPLEAAKREIYEETGAIKYNITPIATYSVTIKNIIDYGQLFFVEIFEFDNLPNFEIEKINLFDSLPKNLTYPDIQPILFDFVEKNIERNS